MYDWILRGAVSGARPYGSCGKAPARRRVRLRVLVALAALAFVLPSVPASAQAANSPGATSWTLVAGQTTQTQAVLECVPAAQALGARATPGRMLLGANAVGGCGGFAIFRYLQRGDLSVVSADIDGAACVANTWFVSCPFSLSVGQQQVISTRIQVGPYARGATEVDVSGVDNPAIWPIDLQAEGTLSVEQGTAYVVPGIDRSGSAQLLVRNSGPSGARDVSVTEQFPPFLSVDTTLAPGCSFDDDRQVLSCRWDQLDPGAALRVPLRLSAQKGVPTSQWNVPLQAQSDLGKATGQALVVASGNAVVGVQSISGPPRIPVYSTVADTVKLSILPRLRGPKPQPGIPARWTLRLPEGLQVQSVTLGPTSGTMGCHYADDTVSCVQPNYGSGQAESDAEARITLRVLRVGRLPISLSWDSTEGSGQTTVTVQSIWEDAAPSGAQ